MTSARSLESVIPELWPRIGRVERSVASRYFRSQFRPLEVAAEAQPDLDRELAVARTAINYGIRLAVMPLAFVVAVVIVLILATHGGEPWLAVSLAAIGFCVWRYAVAMIELRRCHRHFTQHD